MGWDSSRPWWVGPPFLDPQLGVGRSISRRGIYMTFMWYWCGFNEGFTFKPFLESYWVPVIGTTWDNLFLELLSGIVVVRWWLGPKWIRRTLETFRLAARSLKLWNWGDNVFFKIYILLPTLAMCPFPRATSILSTFITAQVVCGNILFALHQAHTHWSFLRAGSMGGGHDSTQMILFLYSDVANT